MMTSLVLRHPAAAAAASSSNSSTSCAAHKHGATGERHFQAFRHLTSRYVNRLNVHYTEHTLNYTYVYGFLQALFTQIVKTLLQSRGELLQLKKTRAGRVDTISGNYTRHETEIFQLLHQIMEVRRLVFGSINLKTRVALKIHLRLTYTFNQWEMKMEGGGI